MLFSSVAGTLRTTSLVYDSPIRCGNPSPVPSTWFDLATTGRSGQGSVLCLLLSGLTVSLSLLSLTSALLACVPVCPSQVKKEPDTFDSGTFNSALFILSGKGILLLSIRWNALLGVLLFFAGPSHLWVIPYRFEYVPKPKSCFNI